MSCACDILTANGGKSGVCYGVNNPNNVFTALFGWLYLEFDSSYVLKNQWVKTTPFGNTGWVVIPSASNNPSVTTGVGPPTSVPLMDAAIYFDKNTGAQYNWWNGIWH